jgi:hypothetical protein
MSKIIDGDRDNSQVTAEPDLIVRRTFQSMAEYSDHVRQLWKCAACWSPVFQGTTKPGEYSPVYDDSRAGWEDLLCLGHTGWETEVYDCMQIADRAVRQIETEVDSFEPQHGLSGSVVDVGTYLSGEPECMVDFPLTKVSNVGNLVSIVVDVQAGVQMSAASIMARGAGITALMVTLDRMGHQSELWISDEYQVARRRSYRGGEDDASRPTKAKNPRLLIRCKIKGPQDLLDPARVMFAVGHPGVSRGYGFTTAQNLGVTFLESVVGEDVRTGGKLGAYFHGNSFGEVTPTTEDFEDGTIYIQPSLRSGDAPNAYEELRKYMAALGLIEDDE